MTLTLLKIWGIATFVLVTGGMFVLRQTFLAMQWRMSMPETWCKALLSAWVTNREAQRVTQLDRTVNGNSNMYLVNRLAGVAVIAGFVSLLGWCAVMVRLNLE